MAWDDFLSGLLDFSQPADYVSLPTDLGGDWGSIGESLGNVPIVDQLPALDYSFVPDLSNIDFGNLGGPADNVPARPDDVLPANLLELSNQWTAGGDNALFGASAGAPGTTGMTNLERMIAAGINPGTGEPLDQGSLWSRLASGLGGLKNVG